MSDPNELYKCSINLSLLFIKSHTKTFPANNSSYLNTMQLNTDTLIIVLLAFLSGVISVLAGF